MEIYGLRREQQVYFSNQEYYTRLEELKRTHLRNMADLEKMYISQEGSSRGEDRDDGLTIRSGWFGLKWKADFIQPCSTWIVDSLQFGACQKAAEDQFPGGAGPERDVKQFGLF